MWNFLGALAAMAGLLVPMACLVMLFKRRGTRPRRPAAIPRPVPPEPADGTPDMPVPVHDAAPVMPFTQPQPPRVVTPVRARRASEPRFELIPHKMGGINARTVLSDELWSRLSAMVIANNGGHCCECANEPRTRMECHEVWKYEWIRRPGRVKPVGVMRLVGLQPLCHLCHMGKHIKYAESRGELPQVMAHLMKLHDGLTVERIGQLMREAVQKSELRYRYEELDLTYLNDTRFDPIRMQLGRHFTANEMPRPVPA